MELEIAELFSNRYKLTDFGSANTMSRQWAAVIQTLALRSPEVLIDAPWDTKVDIWNFGCLMYVRVRKRSCPLRPNMAEQRNGNGHYTDASRTNCRSSRPIPGGVSQARQENSRLL
ncbi:hypothetical protein K474DRAFT_1665278 [Panus rudis PR-1116 ss-1]|nr:hypothetical protein K474DRAFT_1665278 [Panus rudis PR-1116 ss-1]